MTAIYALCVLAGPVLLWIGTQTHAAEERGGFIMEWVLLFVIGLPLTIACALPFLLPAKPWVWVYNLIIICLGLTSCCFLPATIPLLIHWIKPETKAWFNRA